MNKTPFLLIIISILCSCLKNESHYHSINNEMLNVYKSEIEHSRYKILEAYYIFETKNAHLLEMTEKLRSSFEDIIFQIEKNNHKIKPELSKIAELIVKMGTDKYSLTIKRIDILLEANLEQLEPEILKTFIYELESKILSEWINDIGKNDFRFNKLKPILIVNECNIRAGEEFNAEIMIAAFDTLSPPIFTVAGRTIETINYGVGQIKIKPNNLGIYKIDGSVSILKENTGRAYDYPFSFELKVEK